jgi:hypothetical protein
MSLTRRIAQRYLHAAMSRRQLEDIIDDLFENLRRRLERKGYQSGEMIGQQEFGQLLNITVDGYDVPISIAFDRQTSQRGENHRVEMNGTTTYRIVLVLPSFHTIYDMYESDQARDIRQGLIPILAHEIEHVNQDLEGHHQGLQTPEERIEYVNAPAEVDNHPIDLSEQLWTFFQDEDMTDRAPLSERQLDDLLRRADTGWARLEEMLTDRHAREVLEETRRIINERLEHGPDHGERVEVHQPEGDPNQQVEAYIETITEQIWDFIQDRREAGLFEVDTLGPYQGEATNLDDLFILADSDWDLIKDRLTPEHRQHVLETVRARLNQRL